VELYLHFPTRVHGVALNLQGQRYICPPSFLSSSLNFFLSSLSLDIIFLLLCRFHLIVTDVSALRPLRPWRGMGEVNPIELTKGNPMKQEYRYPDTKGSYLFKHGNVLNSSTFIIVFFNVYTFWS
jgi:hypothetical protein